MGLLDWKGTDMWQRLSAFVREWSILILGILLILPFLYLSFQEAPSSKSTESAPSLNQNDGSADPPVAANAPAANPVKPTQRPAQTAGQASPNAAPAAVDADVAAGKLVFRKCQACHSLDPGKNGIGPSLAGIVGKKSGSAPSFNYSTAMNGSNLTWDVATLATYLSDPQKSVPGNKMPFPGLKTENERKAVIAYLAAGASPAAAAPAAARAPAPAAAAGDAPPAAPADQPATSYIPGLRYTLRTGIAEGRMVFIGVGGTIDGQVNPVLSAAEGQGVQITLINGEGAEHDI